MPAVLKGNSRSGVAVCTLWTPANVVAQRLDRRTFQLVANLYSAGGINALLRTILSRPSIRFLILTGADLSGSGDVIAAFFAKGVKAGKVVGTRIYIEKELPRTAVESVRKHVQLVDARDTPLGQLHAQVAALHRLKKKPFAKPRTFPPSDKVVDTLASERTGFIVRAATVAEAWLELLDLVLKFGVEKKSEHGPQRELLNVTTVIEKSGDVPAWLSCAKEDVDRYLSAFFATKRHPDTSYSYGERLFRKEQKLLNRSQMKAVADKLKAAPHSRRAVAAVWQLADLNSESPPCLTHLYWSVQDGRLYQTAHFRSHEAYMAWPMNLYALRRLQAQLAIALKLKLGELTCIAHSLHLYRRDVRKAERALKHRKTRYAVREYDPRGVFTIKLEKRKIVVTHLSMDGQKTGNRFSGTDVEKLLAQLHGSNLISQADHAAYLGMELQKAWFAMKHGKKYVQDGKGA